MLITTNKRIKCSVKDAECMIKKIFYVNISSDFKQSSVMHAKRDGADMDLLLFQVKAEDQKKHVFHLRITTLRREMVGEVTKPTLLASFESQLNMHHEIELYTVYINIAMGYDPVQMDGFYTEI